MLVTRTPRHTLSDTRWCGTVRQCVPWKLRLREQPGVPSRKGGAEDCPCQGAPVLAACLQVVVKIHRAAESALLSVAFFS